jgi:nitroreductase
METIKDLLERRSIRSYKPEPVSGDILDKILEAGTYAPTARGEQVPVIVSVTDKALQDKIRKMNAAVMNAPIDTFYGAPDMVLVFAPPSWQNYIQDASCVLTYMMVAAKAYGVGSCWINRELEMFATDEGKALMKEMGLPEDLTGVGALALGYNAGDEPAAHPRKDGYIVKV